jgi:hypothetical protein
MSSFQGPPQIQRGAVVGLDPMTSFPGSPRLIKDALVGLDSLNLHVGFVGRQLNSDTQPLRYK